jgi:hypothetical protein
MVSLKNLPHIQEGGIMSLQLFLLCQGIGLLFLMGCLVLFFIGKDATLKRKLLLPFFVVSGVLAVGMAYFSQGLVAALVATAIAGFVSQSFLRRLQFCNRCGRVLNDYHGNVPEVCPSCNATVRD